MIFCHFVLACCLLKVLLNPGPCIHYIWSPTDHAFTISGLPQYTHMEMQLF
ncbi:unnamed protein product [Staurois parvus]|uniref:Uncharacterized protein n=1 Tax=Staurois parvus TaxID=386267 RepID=A0ABN9HGA8_9NEOB|nr:unnamed protein product [Staurois parvus]